MQFKLTLFIKRFLLLSSSVVMKLFSPNITAITDNDDHLAFVIATVSLALLLSLTSGLGVYFVASV